MRKCREAQQADLILDGHAWQFATLRDAVTTYRKLRAYRGAQWLDFPATIRRLFAAAPAAEQAWYHREQARLGGSLTPQPRSETPSVASPAVLSQQEGSQRRLLKEMP
jgi:hypothetical protein